MLFPDAKRVIFHKNPLDEAICQFRFPQNLSIETEVPSKFQDLIKDDYPLFNEKVEIQVKFSESPDTKISEMVDFQPSSIKNKNYEFISADEKWKINLTSGFLSLSTIDYSRWEYFSEHLKKPFTALLSIYNPQFFTRIGLRYRDIIRRSKLGLEANPWDELLQPYILGLLMAPNIKDAARNINHISEINLDQESIVRIASGLLHDLETKEEDFIIDSDFFTTNRNIETGKALDILNFFNSQGTRLVQWCILKKLYDAMDPEII